jgi:serine protease inhibitor
MRFPKKLLASALAMFCSVSNAGGALAANNQAGAPATGDKKMSAAMNSFGFGMFRNIWPEGKPSNYVLSPLSVSLALSMTYNGAGGATRAEMAKVMGFSGKSDEQVNQFNSDLIKRMQSADPKTTVNIANALWGKKGMTFEQAFLKANEDFYKARITSLDFANPASVKEINDWVKQQTKGKIANLLDKISADSVLFLTNAIYFKGPWEKPFEKSETKQQSFNLIGRAKKTVPFMMRYGAMQHVQNAAVEAIRLPYGNSSYAMYIVLPAKNSSLMSYIDGLTADKWTALVGSLSTNSGELQLPRFRVEYKKDLTGTLKDVGMRLPFDQQKADFSRMSKMRQLMIQKVVHQTYVDVNEEGTEAAAATAVQIMPTALPPLGKPFKMVVDRPFMFAIADEQSGALMFLGAVLDPKP